MRKQEERKKGLSVSAKILICILCISIGFSSILFVSASYMINRLYQRSLETQESTSSTIAQGGADLLINEATNFLETTAVLNAKTLNETFIGIADELRTLSLTLNRIYKNPDNYVGYYPPHPDDTEDGVLMSRSTIVGSAKHSDKLMREQRLISNIEDFAASTYEDAGVLRMVLIGSQTGIFYRYSDYNNFTPTYDPRHRLWYRDALNKPDTVVWSNAYKEQYGNLVITCSITYRNEKDEIAGVICSDILVQTLIDTMLNSVNDSYDNVFLVDNHGAVIASSLGDDKSSPAALNPADPEMIDILRAMSRGKTGYGFSAAGNDRINCIAYAPIEQTNWSLGVVLKSENVIAPSYKLLDSIQSVTDDANKEMIEAMSQTTIFSLISFLVGIACVIIITLLMTNRIRKPIANLTECVTEMGRGNLDVKTHVKGTDELALLGHSFNKMSDDLKKYITNLQTITEEKERAEAELNVAAHIQSSMLPSIFPPFPDREEFDIFASMDPAKEVGGDFYDFFPVDRDHIALVMADVSGKGVPAALFMVIAKTLIKNQAGSGISPAQVLERVNNQLCESNGAEMFVTAWLGIVNVQTGIIECSSAGHEYPVIMGDDGRFSVLRDRHGMVLAGMADMKYQNYEIALKPGQAIFIYTDGVPESQNAVKDFYGLDRCVDALNEDPSASPEELLKRVAASISSFVDGAPQFDDITMLCYRQLK